MPLVRFLNPVDQFEDRLRLLDELRTSFKSPDFAECLIAVAFAKSGPILRLLSEIQAFRDRGGIIRAIFGIDLRGTSREALELALSNFDETYITHTEATAIFHPKLYIFSGARTGRCFYGSHNLTVGGTETNLEGGVAVDFTLPVDLVAHLEARNCWETLLPPRCKFTKLLDAHLLAQLSSQGYVLDEATSRKASKAVTTSRSPKNGVFPSISPKPPSPIPTALIPATVEAATPSSGGVPTAMTAQGVVRSAIQTLVLQVVVHHNGEMFLSTKAAKQNPQFFGIPFTGLTTPKQAKNKAYPQRVPDPVVDIEVFDSDGKLLVTEYGYNLNTVLYDKKSEIRVTVSPKVRTSVDNLSILVMSEGSGGVDYDMKIYNPVSADYADYLKVCNQTLPSGGAAIARKMGWL